MNTSETLESILDVASGIQISRTPPETPPSGPKFFAKADQLVQTAEPGNFIMHNHQTVGVSIAECLNQLHKQIEMAAKSGVKGKSPILTRDGSRG